MFYLKYVNFRLHFRPGTWFTLFLLEAIVVSAWPVVFVSETSGAPTGRQEIARGVTPGQDSATDRSPVRAAQREKISECRPYRALGENSSSSRGLRPWLFPVAPTGLRTCLAILCGPLTGPGLAIS